MANNVDYSQLSMLEAAKEIVKSSEGPVAVKDIIAKVLELKNIDDNGDKATQLYVDITTSADFVYMGENMWDLKDRQSLEEWDKDASAFNKEEVEEEDTNEPSVEDFETEDEEKKASDDEDDEESDEESEETDEDYEDDGKNPYADDSDYESDDTDESEFDSIRDTPDEDEFDENKYGDIMDTYEDLYDK
ncbi:MAG: DNA-directed RNA polymerase subunit delta [Acholeplasmatales bacterium]|nr:DNA-directed RNA polymerase subunit delta [Acholeplasmatales bacterium]